LEQGSKKRNTPMVEAEACDPPFPRDAFGPECDLFDRHREPSDQLRNLIQMLGILFLNSLGKPKQAFIIAHRGDVAWNDRGYRLQQVGQDVWHQITSGGIRR
jgi:hypothetical protein